MKSDDLTTLKMLWVPRHNGIKGNEEAVKFVSDSPV